MIELFDAARLLPRRDHSLPIAGAALAAGLLGLGVHTLLMQREMNDLKLQADRVQAEIKRLKSAESAPAPALLADLETQARRLEAEVAMSSGGGHPASPRASQWLERLDALSSADVGLSRIEIDRAGSARIEGTARSPQAMSGYVQAWEHQGTDTPMRARTIEVRQDEKTPSLLRFQMRANLPEAAP